ncbi:M9 family metallopeptidase [Shewanella violacea]|uniref:microbial collagenase n=1 Tax=Shewanella violacea (strain JCM 10179 / CIP 106290 / LMG 19151 / DSS12) TaxID=637905 RepID=D4ZCE3_SHEVD|nr:M9 family metallopeptidase [Shewanella violacea]BAJ03688.1 collagenase family [Shewanella violacea DSS12]
MKLKTLVVALGLATSFSAMSNTQVSNHETNLASNLVSPTQALTRTGSPWANAESTSALAAPGPLGLTGPMAATGCSAFIGLNGHALVTELANSDPQCVSPLYNLKGPDATALFSESNMRTVAAAVRDRAPSYTGVDTTGIESLIYFQRAALYVQFYSPNDVPAYSTGVKSDIKTQITGLFNNANIWTVSTANSGVLKETLILIDSIGLGADFNHITKEVLSRYDASWEVNFGMNAAANSIFTTIFRAQWDEPMKALFATDHTILDSMNNFQLRNRHLVGTDAEYVLTNAVREMSRLYHIPSMTSRVKTLVKAVLDSSSKNDASKVIWMAAAEMADYYDRANCNYYNICGFKAQLEAETLTFNWKCSTTLKIRAQDLYRDQASWACNVLSNQETYFHSKLSTGNTPVVNDNNDDLELIIFDSSNDYQSYAGTFFGIATNNGGMYLEGSPAGLKNQARFIAYEAEWRRPDFHVWNLQHEYVHYLDGRYNLQGDFGRAISVDTIWWIEGLAEYISYRDANTTAVTMGETGEFPLSTIFKNNYNSGQDRIYRWGYLAVRFMFENHKADVDQILAYLRNDQYTEYQTFMNNIGTSYDNEWTGWLASGLNIVDNGIIDHGPSDTAALASGKEGNWTGPVSAISTDYSACTVTSEAFRYTTDASLVIDQPMECIDSQNGKASFAFANVDRTNQTLWIKIGGGWGDADIYYSTTGWASGEVNDGFGIGNGNHEVIQVTLNPNEYWHYLTLSGEYGGLDLLVSTSEVFADPDPAQGGGTNPNPNPNPNPDPNPNPTPDCGTTTMTDGQLTFGKDECISGGTSSFYVYVEEDNTQLTITTSGGAGDASLYYNADTWADATNAHARSTNAGNEESIQVTANIGWRYIVIDTDTEYSGVTLNVSLAGGSTPPVTPPAGNINDACQTLNPVSDIQLTSGSAVCSADGINYYSLWVDAGTTELTVATAHGTGDVSLYGGTSWPSAQSNSASSTNAASTSESFTVNNPIEGWYYITLESEVTSSGVAIQADLK